MTRSCKDIRTEFIEFFRERKHAVVPSSSLLPADDPTLLFTNAGMNQFKDVFLGQGKRPYVRAVNSQKCIRAGGKHNDLEDVGHDTYHHTFFEMLGNWSFGDYFKAEAIQWAWELLTKVWGLPPERLHATVFGGDQAEGLDADDEAAELWRKQTSIDPSHVHRGGKKDNFWEMGETGPCGPCSEIHIDLTDDLSGGTLVNAGDRRVMEIWNLVFMQFNRYFPDETTRRKYDEAVFEWDNTPSGDRQHLPYNSRDAILPRFSKLSLLPAKHVDTGMGLERIGMVLAGKLSNYATDLFVPIIRQVETFTKHRYGAGEAKSAGADRFDAVGTDDLGDVACRVVADHARTLAFAIADGVIPSNDGRGYVLRRILRRAARYGRQYLHIEGPFLAKLVPTIVDMMGETFPELRQRQKAVTDTILQEEESFGRTLDRGLRVFQQRVINDIGWKLAAERGLETWEAERKGMFTESPDELPWVFRVGSSQFVLEKIEDAAEFIRKNCKSPLQISGETAFELYATYGFPVDLTQVMAREAGLTVDVDGYESAMARHRELSGAGEAFRADSVANLPATDDSAKYSRKPIQATVLGWVADGAFVTAGELDPSDEAAVVLDRTNFYGEQGGQVGDAGALVFEGGHFNVRHATLAGQCVLHVGRMDSGVLRPGQQVTAMIDPSRFDTMRNHTATHLVNWALRRVLGDHVNQAGSVVAPDRLRFDFTHNAALTPEQLVEAERLVNERVLADQSISVRTMPLAEAKKIPGVRAVFGEKYPDPVRVIRIGDGGESADISAEFCGGTHLERTSPIGLFKVIAEESVAKGVRRITAVTGREAVAWAQDTDRTVREMAELLRTAPAEMPARLAAMQKELKELRKAPKSAGGGEGAVEMVASGGDGRLIVARVASGPDPAAMRNLCDQYRQKGAQAVFLGGADGEKVTLVAMVADELAQGGKFRAGDWVKAIAPTVGGSGGGKPTLAQAGGRQPEKLPEALKLAAEWASGKLAKS